MEKAQIQKELLKLGITSQYSGREKSFYVSKLPNDSFLNEIKKEGFEIKVRRNKKENVL